MSLRRFVTNINACNFIYVHTHSDVHSYLRSHRFHFSYKVKHKIKIDSIFDEFISIKLDLDQYLQKYNIIHILMYIWI